jgi:hypothetical protein
MDLEKAIDFFQPAFDARQIVAEALALALNNANAQLKPGRLTFERSTLEWVPRDGAEQVAFADAPAFAQNVAAALELERRWADCIRL